MNSNEQRRFTILYYVLLPILVNSYSLRGTTSLTAWKKVIFVNLKKKYRIEYFKILQIYFCINNEYKVIFSDENIRFSASYPPSPESLKKKSSHCCSDCNLHSVWNKKNQKFYKTRIYFLYNDPRLQRKIEMQQNGRFFKIKLKFCWKIWWFLAWKNYIFHSIIKLEGHCIEKQIHNKLRKDSSRSDDLLSSYSCSKFEKFTFEKNAFKDKSRQSPNNNSGTVVK